jgi:tetratricopeptide (TPR) repeat protein
MKNDAQTPTTCSEVAPMRRRSAEIGKGEGSGAACCETSRRVQPAFADARRYLRFFSRSTGKVVLLLAMTSWALPSRAEPPRGGGSSKSDAGSPAKPSAAPGRSKGPTTAPPPAAPPLKSEPEGPEAEGKTRAQAIFEQAVAAYKDGRYFDAVELFLETNRIYPDSKLCFNIARAYEGLGNTGGALRYYREYLRRTPSATDRAEVEASVRQLELTLSQKGVQQMSVFSTPDAGVLSIDGQPVALTPWTGETWPGKHRLTVTRAGYLESQQVVELSPHRSIDVQIELRTEPPPRPAPAPVAEVRPESGRRVEVLTVATLAAGAVLLGSALAVELSNSDSGTSGTAAFLAGAGVGATAVGGVLFYFDLSASRSK